MSDRIAAVGMKVSGRHSVVSSEPARGQRFPVGIEVEADLRRWHSWKRRPWPLPAGGWPRRG
jgi:hypothetical protein